MQKYAHIGYPKAASTWLQVFLFPRHPDVYHLGRSNGDQIVDDDLRLALWNDLITQPSFLYRSEEMARLFDRLFAEAEDRRVRACGISQEVLTLSLIGNLDIAERARRLRAAMGDGTSIIIVIRNQFDWIRSLFCGLLKGGGMTYGLEDFLFYFYYQQDQSPFSSLFYDEVYELYADLFGQQHVHVVPYELIKRDARAFAARICDAIGVATPAEVPSQSINERPSPEALTAALAFNRENNHFFGTHQFHRPWGFKAASLFRKRFDIDPPAWMVEESQKSKFVYDQIEDMVVQAGMRGEQIPGLDTTFPERYTTLLARAYASHNTRLTRLAGVDLAELGYPV